MPVRTFAVEATPGDSGFVEELNSVLLDVASYASKVVRVDVKTFNVGTATGASKAIEHKLGVTPDFIWAIENPPTTTSTPITVSPGEKATWDARTVRFTPRTASVTLYLCIIALT